MVFADDPASFRAYLAPIFKQLLLLGFFHQLSCTIAARVSPTPTLGRIWRVGSTDKNPGQDFRKAGGFGGELPWKKDGLVGKCLDAWYIVELIIDNICIYMCIFIYWWYMYIYMLPYIYTHIDNVKWTMNAGIYIDFAVYMCQCYIDMLYYTSFLIHFWNVKPHFSWKKVVSN